MSTDAIVLLKDDHKKVRKLFKEFQSAGEDATGEKGRLVKNIIEALTVHTYIENEVMYPEVRKRCPNSRMTFSPHTPDESSALKKAIDAVTA